MMAKGFKIGDKVRCVDPSGHPYTLRKGGEYTVIWVSSPGSIGMLQLREAGSVALRADRFELVEPEKPAVKGGYLVLNMDGPKSKAHCSTTLMKTVLETLEEAQADALARAKKYPDQRYTVLQIVGEAGAVEPVIEFRQAS